MSLGFKGFRPWCFQWFGPVLREKIVVANELNKAAHLLQAAERKGKSKGQ